MENINEEVNYMKYLFGYKKGVVISEQTTPTQVNYATDPTLQNILTNINNLNKIIADDKKNKISAIILSGEPYKLYYNIDSKPGSNELTLYRHKQKVSGGGSAYVFYDNIARFLFGSNNSGVDNINFNSFLKSDDPTAAQLLNKIKDDLKLFTGPTKFSKSAKTVTWTLDSKEISDPTPPNLQSTTGN